MTAQKTIVFFPEAAFGPALNSVGIAQACRDLGFIDDARWFLEHANPGPSVPLQAPHRLLRLDRLKRTAGVRRTPRDDEPQAK